MVTKSTTATKPAETATATPATAPAAESQYGRLNPLSAVMRIVVGKQPTADESSALAQFITGAVRLTDSHIYALARFFTKRYHVQLSTLALKVARYQAAHTDGLTVQAAKAAIEEMLGIHLAEWDTIEGNFSNEYERYRIDEVKAAHSTFWDAYGQTGDLHPGLITLANAYDKQTREQRQADMA